MEGPTANGRPLGREGILAGANRRVTETVDVPELGGRVCVRELSTAERDEYEVGVLTTRGRNVDVNLRGLRSRLVAYCVVDEAGVRLFDPDNADDLAAIGTLGARGVDRIFTVAQRLNGLSAEDVTELAGNSSGVPSGASASP